MSRTMINVGAVINAAYQINSAKSSVSSAKSSFTQTRNNIDGKIQNRSNIRNRLDTVQTQLTNIESRIGKIGTMVQSGANQYKSTDDSVKREGSQIKSNLTVGSGRHESIFSRFFDEDYREKVKNAKKNLRKEFDIPDSCPEIVLERILEMSDDLIKFSSAISVLQMGEEAFSLFGVESENVLDIFGTDTFKTYILKKKGEYSTISIGNTEKSLNLDMESSIELDKLDKKLKPKKEQLEKFLKDNKLFKEEKDTKYFDGDKELDEKDAPDFYERQAAIAEIKVGGKESVSLYDKEFEFLGGTGSVTVAEAEAHAELAAGFYIVGKEGERIFSPGVSAEIGASVTGFHADYENQLLGNEMIGLNVDGEVTALSASAKASAEINLMGKDKNGNVVFDPQLNVGVEAEAVLVEAEGSVGLNVLGGEASLKGSVKVGVGAHADIGMKDGVIKCEIGASLGVGFDVGFEVDVGGMVNTVADAAKSAWEGFKSWWG